MSLLSSLFAGVSGLRNHQSMMDVIGDNIANVNTIGFKASRVTFSDTFSQLLKAGTNPTDTSGGVNSFQIGLGAKINSIDRNWNQGTFERTGVTTDLALQGPGLFVLKKNGQTFYSRAGAFNFDADGKLVNTQNGAIVQGKIANSDGVIPPGNNLEDIKIDHQLKLPAVATSQIKWGGNLKSDADLTRSENIIQRGNINSSTGVDASGNPIPTITNTTVYDNNGNSYDLKLIYTPLLDASNAAIPNEYSLKYELYDPSSATPDVAVDSGDISPRVVFADNNGTYTIQDVYDPANPANKLTDASGKPVTSFDYSYGTDVNFKIDFSQVTNNASTATLSASADGNREPNIVTGSVTTYDSLGNPHLISIKFTKIDTNIWNWSASVPATDTIDGKAVTTSGQVTFNADGTLDPANISPNNPKLTFLPEGGGNPLVIDLDLGKNFEGVTQTASSSVISALSQDGSPSATLSNINIDQFGNIVGVFSNGNSRTLAQMLVSSFTNPNGLIKAGDNLYTAYANAGIPKISELGEESGTTVQSGALEQSNVDLAEEFTKMIVAQRGFQANAKIISTSDSLLQEINNLVR